MVAPREGAWIEISFSVPPSARSAVAPREGAWIEIIRRFLWMFSQFKQSLPMWKRALKYTLTLNEIFPNIKSEIIV